MSTSPRNDFYHPKLCCLCCMLIKSTHPKYRFWGSFLGACKTPMQNSEISHGWMLWLADSRLLFQTWTNQCRIIVQKGCIVLVTEKKQNTFWCRSVEALGDFPEIFYASAHCGPTLIFHVSFRSVQVWGSYNRKSLPQPHKVKTT